MKVKKIIERNDVASYLEQRNLAKQYKKAKKYILFGFFGLVDFKKRKPAKDGVWYFRINKQFRAICYLEESVLVVVEISNHQE